MASNSNPPEFCPTSEEAPVLAAWLCPSVATREELECLRLLRRELAALRQKWMREARAEALRDLLDTLERFDVPHYHEHLPDVHCAGCWQGLVLRELRERIEAES
jgi:hypothetical protein